MSDAFNPYAEWLGLANVSSRPNHYTLLGLELYASDPAQIKQAADRAVTRVRGFRPGDKARFWATLLDEIDVARKCLGDDAARRDYDAQLRTQGPDLGVAEKSPTGFAAGAAPQKTPSNPAMYPPGMGGPLPERYGPAGPAPDDAPQQLASSMTAASGASRFAPGYAGSPAPAATATPQQSIASPGTLSMPRKLPMGRDQNPAASPDPMAPVYGMQPQGDPMAPVGDMNSGYSAQPYGQPMTAQPASPAGYGAASYGAAAYGGAMQPVTAVQLQSGAAMAPVAMPVGGTSYDSSGYSAANAGYGNGHAGGNAGGAYGQGASAWGNASAMSTAAMPIPVASASSAPQVVAVGGKPSSNAQKNLMLGLAAVGLLVVGGLISYLVMGGHQPENDNEQVVASVGPDAAGETPVTTTPDDDPPQTPDTTPTTPEPQPEPQPEVTPPPQPEPEKTPSPEPTPEPAPEPVKEPDPPMPQPEPEPEPQPPPPMITPQEKAALKKALVAARQAMTDGDLEAAREQLAEAEKLARSDEHIAVVERTKELEHYLSEFWSAFDKAYAGLQPTNTITIDTAEAAIVEVRPDALVIKWFGRNRTIPRQGMPAGLVMAIANEWFDDQPANKVVKGAYYFVNNKPDKAEQMWSEAGDSGVPVKSLMKVLDDDYEL